MEMEVPERLSHRGLLVSSTKFSCTMLRPIIVRTCASSNHEINRISRFCYHSWVIADLFKIIEGSSKAIALRTPRSGG